VSHHVDKAAASAEATKVINLAKSILKTTVYEAYASMGNLLALLVTEKGCYAGATS
jgi:hypothetical protein